jgi:hypothetical protein
MIPQDKMMAYMRRGLALLVIVLFTVIAGEAQTNSSKPRQSLRYSCLGKPFLSVSAYAGGHASFPDVKLASSTRWGDLQVTAAKERRFQMLSMAG